MSSWARWLCVSWIALGALRASAQEDARVLDERGVVALVRKQNPDLKAALARLESSSQSVSGLVERYAAVVQVDGSASDITNPTLTARGTGADGTLLQGVNRGRVRRVDVGAELRKHLIWGTDLSLRLAGAIYETRNYRPSVLVLGEPSGGTSGVPTFVFPPVLGPGYLVNTKLTLKQPLLRGFGRDVAEADLNAARVERTGAEHTRDRVASERLRDALGAYWELWYAHTALAIQQASRDLAVRQRDDAQQRVATGTLAPVEVLAFETELAAREEEVASAEAERKRAELELARLLGAGVATFGVAEERPPDWLSGSGVVLEQDALANSAEVRERAAALELASVRARTASDPQRQRLDLDSYVQLQGLSTQNPADAYGEYGNARSVSGFIGLTYETPVNGRAERAAAAKARADVEAATQDLASVKQRVLAEAHKAEERGRAQGRSVTLAEQTLAIAEKQYAAEQARFQSGTGTTLEVIVAEGRVRNARLREARARADLAQTGLSLAHLTGRLLGRWAN